MFQLFSVQTILLIISSIAVALTAQYMLNTATTITTTVSTESSMRASQILRNMSSSLSHAKIVRRPSSTRGAANHGWLNTKHSFSFASWYDPNYESFGSLRVLNEDRVAPNTGFPTHPHRDAEIFSYIISGELTHRDSMQKKGAESSDKDKFYRMKRSDVQFTTGGKGIAHSEQNEHDRDWVHFLQIWATPWKRGLPPTYHTNTFSDEDKRNGFVTIITPLKAGRNATLEEEKAAVPSKSGTIPIHADLVFSAGIVAPGKTFEYKIGADAVQSTQDRRVYVHLPETAGGNSKIKVDGRDDVILEGDAAMITGVNAGDVLRVESVGSADAEVVVLDSN